MQSPMMLDDQAHWPDEATPKELATTLAALLDVAKTAHWHSGREACERGRYSAKWEWLTCEEIGGNPCGACMVQYALDKLPDEIKRQLDAEPS